MTVYEALQGGFGEQGNKAIYFRGTRNKSLKLKGTGEQRQFWGTGNIEIRILILGNKEKCRFFQGNKRTGNTHWKGLVNKFVIWGCIRIQGEVLLEYN